MSSMRLHLIDLGDRHAKEGIDIVLLSDLHTGNPAELVSATLREIEWVKAKPNRYALLLGDMMEAILPDSKGDIWEQDVVPKKQSDTVVKRLRPIKDRILAAVSGNHEFRVYERTSYDPAQLYCADLGIEHYEQDGMALAIRFGDRRGRGSAKFESGVSFTGYITHGWGAARTLGAKLNNVLQLRPFLADADFYASGHVHEPITAMRATFLSDLVHKQVKRKDQLFISVGSAVEDAPYGVRKGMSPASCVFPKMHLGSRSVWNPETKQGHWVKDMSILMETEAAA